MILAADLGGTRSRLLLAECVPDGWRELRQKNLPSHAYGSLAELLEDFLQPGERPVSACIAAAGPLNQTQLQMTNLPWLLDAVAIARQFGIDHVQLLNDFTAQTYALPGLQPHQLCTLQTGKPQHDAVRALLGAGTGLGMALLAGSEECPMSLPSQGGHADFAPADQQQIDLLRFLLPTCGRVSLELLLSGRGLTRLYGFIGKRPLDDPELPDAHAISLAADAGEPLAIATLQLFARLYAATAGNLALTSLPFGGLYLSGGIAPKILPYLQQDGVLQVFNNRSPMQPLLQSIPLHVVLDENLGLHGAAQVAAHRFAMQYAQA